MRSSKTAKPNGQKSSKPDPDARNRSPSLHDEAVQNALQQALRDEDLHRLDLARRLHKDVAGNLVGCTALSEMIRHQLSAMAGASEGVASTLARIDNALRDTLQVVRALTEEQFPPLLMAFGLSTALQQFVKHMVGGFTGALILHVDEDELKLDAPRRLNLFRLLQIMIRRCVCDARASVVEVRFAAIDGHIECTIDHDGDANLWSASAEAAELALIEARCALLGGAFCLTPSPTGSPPGLH